MTTNTKTTTTFEGSPHLETPTPEIHKSPSPSPHAMWGSSFGCFYRPKRTHRVLRVPYHPQPPKTLTPTAPGSPSPQPSPSLCSLWCCSSCCAFGQLLPHELSAAATVSSLHLKPRHPATHLRTRNPIVTRHCLLTDPEGSLGVVR